MDVAGDPLMPFDPSARPSGPPRHAAQVPTERDRAIVEAAQAFTALCKAATEALTTMLEEERNG